MSTFDYTTRAQRIIGMAIVWELKHNDVPVSKHPVMQRNLRVVRRLLEMADKQALQERQPVMPVVRGIEKALAALRPLGTSYADNPAVDEEYARQAVAWLQDVNGHLAKDPANQKSLEQQVVKSALKHGAKKADPKSVFRQRILESIRRALQLRNVFAQGKSDPTQSRALYGAMREAYAAARAAGNNNLRNSAHNISSRVLAADGAVDMGKFPLAAEHMALMVRDLKGLL